MQADSIYLWDNTLRVAVRHLTNLWLTLRIPAIPVSSSYTLMTRKSEALWFSLSADTSSPRHVSDTTSRNGESFELIQHGAEVDSFKEQIFSTKAMLLIAAIIAACTMGNKFDRVHGQEQWQVCLFAGLFQLRTHALYRRNRTILIIFIILDVIAIVFFIIELFALRGAFRGLRFSMQPQLISMSFLVSIDDKKSDNWQQKS